MEFNIKIIIFKMTLAVIRANIVTETWKYVKVDPSVLPATSQEKGETPLEVAKDLMLMDSKNIICNSAEGPLMTSLTPSEPEYSDSNYAVDCWYRTEAIGIHIAIVALKYWHSKFVIYV